MVCLQMPQGQSHTVGCPHPCTQKGCQGDPRSGTPAALLTVPSRFSLCQFRDCRNSRKSKGPGRRSWCSQRGSFSRGPLDNCIPYNARRGGRCGKTKVYWQLAKRQQLQGARRGRSPRGRVPAHSPLRKIEGSGELPLWGYVLSELQATLEHKRLSPEVPDTLLRI